MEKDISFWYIVLEQNPAGIATRGPVVFEIKQSTLWWYGLSWLQNDKSSWPEWNFFNMDSKVLNQIQSEIRENKETAIIAGVNKQDQKETKSLFAVNENQYSSVWKLLWVSVDSLRFIKQRVWNQINVDKQQQFYGHKLLMAIFDNLKQSNPISYLSINQVAVFIMGLLYSTSTVFRCLHSYHNKKHCLQKQLGLKIIQFEILRCYGRYLHADLTEECFTYLVIQETHTKMPCSVWT